MSSKEKLDKMLGEVLKNIKPTDKKLLKDVDAFLKKLNAQIKKSGAKATAVMGGSIAKDTYLAGDHDCDIFVRFSRSYKDKDLSKELSLILKPFKPKMVHGSRDYYHIKNGINYEIVPVLDIKQPSDAANVTDMSPLHVSWVKKHPGFNDDIRLAKQFCKAAHVYGAESYIKGFSGHVLDILVIHYGGFIKLLRASQKWKDKEVIDPEKHYKRDALKQLNRSKIDSPIIIIDPVLPQRNAAAALSYDKLDVFRKAASEFLAHPEPSFFVITEKTEKELKQEAGNNKLLLIDVEAFAGKEDIVGAKLLKAFQQIRNQLKFYDFEVLQGGWKWNKKKKAQFWYILPPKELMKIKKWIGPPLSEKDRVKNFKSKYKKTFTENGRICTYVQRRYIKPEQLIDHIIKHDEHLYEKVKKAVRR